MMEPKTNIGANLLVRQGAKPQTAADATYVSSEIYDRLSADMKSPQSMVAIAAVCFTTASGNSTGLNTLTLSVEHGDDSGLSDTAELDSDTYGYAWAADGANHGVHVLPVDLSTAKRYIRVRAKLTKTGTETISAQQIASCAIFGGMDQVPSSTHAAAGYEETTEAA